MTLALFSRILDNRIMEVGNHCDENFKLRSNFKTKT